MDIYRSCSLNSATPTSNIVRGVLHLVLQPWHAKYCWVVGHTAILLKSPCSKFNICCAWLRSEWACKHTDSVLYYAVGHFQ